MRALDVEAVQAFVLTADLKSFTRAAEAMDTTQSADQPEDQTAGGRARPPALGPDAPAGRGFRPMDMPSSNRRATWLRPITARSAPLASSSGALWSASAIISSATSCRCC